MPAAKTKMKAVKLGPRFLRAFEFAAEKHAGQTRKASTIPYIAHLMGVASLALEFGGDEDLAIAALLHDRFHGVRNGNLRRRWKIRGARQSSAADCRGNDAVRALHPAGCHHESGDR